jgi:hypothetical protein
MVKSTISWVLLIVGGLLTSGGMIGIAIGLFCKLKMRFSDRSTIPALLSPPPTLLDTVELNIPWLHLRITTEPWAFLIATIGMGLLVIAVGLHIHFLHRLDLGRQLSL